MRRYSFRQLPSDLIKNPEELLKYANWGDSKAAILLGNMYHYGGIKEGDAVKKVADPYLSSVMLKKSESEAIFWWKRSIEDHLRRTSEEYWCDDFSSNRYYDQHVKRYELSGISESALNAFYKAVTADLIINTCSIDYSEKVAILKSIAECNDLNKYDISLNCPQCINDKTTKSVHQQISEYCEWVENEQRPDDIQELYRKISDDEAELDQWEHEVYADKNEDHLLFKDDRLDGHTLEEAIYWLREAIKKMPSWIKYRLGMKYLHGSEVKRSYYEAMRWIKVAADEGCMSAMNDLVVFQNLDDHKMYESHFSKNEDFIGEDIDFMYPGFPISETDISLLENNAVRYKDELKGKSAPLDPSYHCISEFVDGGLTSMYNLGNIYFYNYDKERVCINQTYDEFSDRWDKENIRKDITSYDYAKSAYWYNMAAEMWYPYAQEKLCLSYILGLGVEQSFEKAKFWWDRLTKTGKSSFLNEIAPFREYLDNKEN